MKTRSLAIALGLVVGLSSCGDTSVTITPTPKPGAGSTGTGTFTGTGTGTAVNTAPTVNLTNNSVASTLIVNSNAFDADGDALYYAWKVDGNPVQTFGATLTYPVTASKLYNVSVTVTDTSGASVSGTGTYQVDLAAAGNSAPVANFNFLSDMLAFNFSNKSTDVDGDQLSYQWSFGDNNTSNLASPSHTYAFPGDYDVSLVVTDSKGKASEPMIRKVKAAMTANTAPTARISVVSVDGLSVSLSSAGSTDPENDSMSFSWDMGDMTNPYTMANMENYMFSMSGAHLVTLTVTDARGASSSVTETINIANQAPVAMFVPSVVGQTLTLDGSFSTDLEDNTADLNYTWSFLDGANQVSLTGINPNHTFVNAGDVSVKLVVTDSNNLSSTITKNVTITATTAENHDPVAKIGFSNNGLIYTFDSAASSDVDAGDEAGFTYAWKVDNVASGSAATLVKTFEEGKTYSISLTVTDPSGASDTDVTSVTTKAPTHEFTGDPVTGEMLYDDLGCTTCHDKMIDGVKVRGAADNTAPFAPIPINRYLDHQADLFSVIRDTMPKSNATACVGQCAADIDAFMKQWPRLIVEVSCDKASDELKYGPRQMRLLTADEYKNTVKDLFGFDINAADLPSDDQVHFFSNQAKTALDSARLDTFVNMADKIIDYSRGLEYANIAGYDDGITGAVARAFRRPLSADEVAGYNLLEEDGPEYSLKAMLTSPNFLFRSELGMTPAEFIEFNQNAAPVYKTVGDVRVIAPADINNGGELDIYQSTQISHTFTGDNLVQIRVTGSDHVGYGDDAEDETDSWPTLTVKVGGVEQFVGNMPPKAKTVSILVNLNGSQTIELANTSPLHPQDGTRPMTFTSISISKFEQVQFEIPNIDDDAYALTPYEIATFLAYTYTGTTPDAALMEAANEGFTTDAAIEAQIERLLATDKAKVRFGKFVDQWLQTNAVLSVPKSTELYADFTPAVRQSMVQEAREIFKDVMFNDAGFTKLFDSNYTFVDKTLADFYGLGGVTGNNFVKVTAPERGGLITTGAFLSAWARTDESHLIKRAVRVRERAMCQHMPPFPSDVSLDEVRSRQEAVVNALKEQNNGLIRQSHLDFVNTAVPECATCHQFMINPLGLGMEDYDAVGRPRSTYANGLSVNFEGTDPSIEEHNSVLFGIDDVYNTNDGRPFRGTKELGQVLAAEEVTRECLQEMSFRFVMDTGPDEFDHADLSAVEMTDDERSDYSCVMSEMLAAMSNAGDNPKAAFIKLGLSDIVRFRKERNR